MHPARSSLGARRDASTSATSSRCATSDLDIGRGEFFTLLGPERLRQDHDAADGRRLRGADRRARPDRRRGRRRPAAAQAPTNTVFQSYALFPAPERRRQRRLRAARARGPEGEMQPAGHGGARAGRARGGGQAQAEPALRRPAAARGAGAGARQPAQGAAARRAARRARPEAPQGPPGRAEADPARGRDHLRLRHPRPGGGADDVGRDRGDEPRPHRAGRRSRRRSTSARRPASSPGSSASPT